MFSETIYNFEKAFSLEPAYVDGVKRDVKGADLKRDETGEGIQEKKDESYFTRAQKRVGTRGRKTGGRTV